MFQKLKLVGGIGDMEAESTTPFSYLSQATTNQTLVKAGPCVLCSLYAINVNAAVRYLKFYDTRGTPTAGSGVPKRRYAIPGATAGAGAILTPLLPMRFDNGISFTIVANAADNDTTAVGANDVILTLEYI